LRKKLRLDLYELQCEICAKEQRTQAFEVSGRDVKVQLLRTEKLQIKKVQATNKLPVDPLLASC
jgi:spore cortex formation protein SpoVR/YcgB (stage V sporulation)